MDLIHVIILAIVEGVTEFLPISSTAHLILTSHILSIPTSEFLSTFEIAIQIGAIAAVAVVYYRKMLKNKALFYKACIGFIPTGILGFLFYKDIKLLLSNSFIPVAALFLGGIAIIGIELYFKSVDKRNKTAGNRLKTLDKLSYKDALIIGLIQSISMIPGVSRSAASIFGSMALRFDRESAVEFAFLLAIPTMIIATGVDVIKSANSFTSVQAFDLIVGILISFVVALLVIKWLLKYVQKNSFVGFGIYRIVLSIAYYLIFLR